MQFDRDMNSEYAELFLEVREFVMEHVPEGFELLNEHITSYKTKLGMYCYLKVKDNYVHIGWGRGAAINDTYGVLIGKGSIVRGQKVHTLDAHAKTIIADFINQTTGILLEHDAKKRARCKK